MCLSCALLCVPSLRQSDKLLTDLVRKTYVVKCERDLRTLLLMDFILH